MMLDDDLLFLWLRDFRSDSKPIQKHFDFVLLASDGICANSIQSQSLYLRA